MTMMRIAKFAAVLILLLASSDYPAAADIYKYRDTNGVVRYTYDLAEVPEEQRPQTQTYQETPSAPETPLPVNGEAGDGQDKSNEAPDEDIVVDEETIEELNQRKKKLDEEFAGLMEEKYALLKDKAKLETLAGRNTVAAADYDKKVEDLNLKIEDYQKRREAFQKEAEAVKKAIENPGS
jgi:chaperonin cofactor prefoldin